MVKIIGYKIFKSSNASNINNNSIFLDSSDNKIKFKDHNGNIIIL